MIGNDVVDLKCARKESNWERKGFLQKIFTENEIKLIQKSLDPEIMIWKFWTMKEASYKIWNRSSEKRLFNPIKFECQTAKQIFETVRFGNQLFFTKTKITVDYIHTIAVKTSKDLNNIQIMKKQHNIIKINALPHVLSKDNQLIAVSKSHHGNYEFLVKLSDT